MAWHHDIHKHAARHVEAGVGSFAHSHPWVTFILAGTGVAAVVHMATGKHATPSPSTQNQTPTNGG